MWSPNELLKIEKQRDILSYITLQFFPFKKVPLEHYPKDAGVFVVAEIPQITQWGNSVAQSARSTTPTNATKFMPR